MWSFFSGILLVDFSLIMLRRVFFWLKDRPGQISPKQLGFWRPKEHLAQGTPRGKQSEAEHQFAETGAPSPCAGRAPWPTGDGWRCRAQPQRVPLPSVPRPPDERVGAGPRCDLLDPQTNWQGSLRLQGLGAGCPVSQTARGFFLHP